MTDPADAKPRRNWIAFRLRSLVILVLVAGGGLGWMIHRARVRRDAVAHIRQAGGEVFYSWEWDEGSPIQAHHPPWPKWLVDTTGIDLLSNVVAVRTFNGRAFSDDDLMADVACLERVEDLTLFTRDMTDVGFARLRTLKSIKRLDIYNHQDARLFGFSPLDSFAKLEDLRIEASVCDEDLIPIARLANLTSLYLTQGDRISNDGFGRLRTLTRLETLVLTDSLVTDMKPLLDLPRLKDLALARCPIDDVAAAPIAGIPKLAELQISSGKITDASLLLFSRLPHLKKLYLDSCQITDAGLVGLSRSSSLEILDVSRSQVSDSGLTFLANSGFMDGNRCIVAVYTRVSPGLAREFGRKFPHLTILAP